MKRKEWGCGAIVAAYMLAGFALLSIPFFMNQTELQYYQTTEISDYGIYIGNGNNVKPIQFIQSFFPAEIDQTFSDVQYSYRAENYDTYGYEAYLEFVIEDPVEFEEYISSLSSAGTWNVFLFDDDYMECNIANVLDMDTEPIMYGEQFKSQYEESEIIPDYSIDYAEIGKILYSKTEQRVIFVAIGVFDGGAASTAYLCKFFERFYIDPLEYLQTAEGTRG